LSIIFRRYQTKLLNNIEITQLQLFFASLLIVAASLISKEGVLSGNWSLMTLFVIIVAGYMNTMMIYLTNYGFEHVKTSIAANILTLEMYFAVILRLLFYKEVPTMKDLAGAVLILFSVIQMNKLK